MRNIYRNGDLPIVPLEEKLTGKTVEHNGSFVLAWGEQTGHRHTITVERPQDMEIFDLGGGLYMLDLHTQATITHEEHAPLVLNPGVYRVGREREFDHFANTVRQVVD